MYHLLFLYLMFVHRCHILRAMKQTLLFAGLLDVAMSTAAAVDELHRGNDDGAELIHVDDRYHFLGGRLTTWHLDLEEGKERRSQAW